MAKEVFSRVGKNIRRQDGIAKVTGRATLTGTPRLIAGERRIRALPAYTAKSGRSMWATRARTPAVLMQARPDMSFPVVCSGTE